MEVKTLAVSCMQLAPELQRQLPDHDVEIFNARKEELQAAEITSLSKKNGGKK